MGYKFINQKYRSNKSLTILFITTIFLCFCFIKTTNTMANFGELIQFNNNTKEIIRVFVDIDENLKKLNKNVTELRTEIKY